MEEILNILLTRTPFCEDNCKLIVSFLSHPVADIVKEWINLIPIKSRLDIRDSSLYAQADGYKETIGAYEAKYMMYKKKQKYGHKWVRRNTYPPFEISRSIVGTRGGRSVAKICYSNALKYYTASYFSEIYWKKYKKYCPNSRLNKFSQYWRFGYGVDIYQYNEDLDSLSVYPAEIQ